MNREIKNRPGKPDPRARPDSGDRPAQPRWAPARDRVYEYIRDGVVQGRLPGGSFLEEEQVSLAVGVSRTPVREAFQRLQGDHLIELVPRHGAMVRAVTVQELLEVNETRLVIETHAVRTLCREALPPPPDMAQAQARMRQEPAESGLVHVQLNTLFHQALVDAAGNGVIAGLYRSLSVRQERVAMTAVSIEPGRHCVILAEHDQLLAALAAHDAEAAIAILTTHLRPIREIVSRLPG